MPPNQTAALRHVGAVRKLFKKHNISYAVPRRKSEAWHHPAIRSEMGRYVLARAFRYSGRNKTQLIKLVKDLEKNFEEPSYAPLKNYIKQRQIAHPNEKVELNLLRELKIAKSEIDSMGQEILSLDNIIEKQKLPHKVHQMKVARSGLGNISNGISNYIELLIDYLEKQQENQK